MTPSIHFGLTTRARTTRPISSSSVRTTGFSGRVVRARVVNPKWIDGVMRHGYKGAFEIAATVDFMFAFAATTGAVKDHHFEAAYNAYLRDERVRDFLMQKNPAALAEMAARFAEAIDRKLWTPRSNSARYELDTIGKRRAS